MQITVGMETKKQQTMTVVFVEMRSGFVKGHTFGDTIVLNVVHYNGSGTL